MEMFKKWYYNFFCILAILVFTFFLGGFLHKRGIQHIPGAVSVVDSVYYLLNPDILYDADQQGNAELFRKESVSYPFTFIVYGDAREPASFVKEILIQRIIDEKPDFVIDTGDIVYAGDRHQWNIADAHTGKIWRSGIPYYPVLGNHEYKDIYGDYAVDPANYLDLFFEHFPILKGKRWYSFVYGNSKFLMLDSNTDHSRQSMQYNWLMNELSGEQSPFTFVVLHHPIYSNIKSIREAEKNLTRLFRRLPRNALPSIIFNGDVHNYERWDKDDTHYIGTGGGGAEPHYSKWNMASSELKPGETYHYCKVRVDENGLLFKMIKYDELSKRWIEADEFIVLRKR